MVRDMSFQPKLSPQPDVQTCHLESKIAGMEREKFKTHQFSVSHHFPCNVIHLGMYFCTQSMYLLNSHPPTLLQFPFSRFPEEFTSSVAYHFSELLCIRCNNLRIYSHF